MIQEFVKKPVKVPAVQWTGNNEHEIMDFVGMKLQVSRPPNHYEHDNYITDDMVTITIPTLEDGKNGQVAHVANRYDWILKGVKGEFYPCKPDIFADTYRKVKKLQEEDIPQFQESIDSLTPEQIERVDKMAEAKHQLGDLFSLQDIRKLRNYFLQNDKTAFEHWAYTYLNNILSSLK